MLSLMRRYVHGFVNAHDPEVARSIMSPDYRLHMGSDTLVGRDDQYIPAVLHQLGQFPGLGFSIHELITDGTMAALSFSEHGRSARPPHAGAVWRGVSIYRAEAGRLAECWVEQDHFGRRHQLASGKVEAVRPVAVDPWSSHLDPAEASRSAAESVLRGWLGAQTSWPPSGARVDSGSSESVQPRIDIARTSLNAFVVEGVRIAFNATIGGTYRGGLLPEGPTGVPVTTAIGAFATLVDKDLDDVDIISNRVLVQRQVRTAGEDVASTRTT